MLSIALTVLNLVGSVIHLIGAYSCYKQKDKFSLRLFSCMATLFIINIIAVWR